MKQVESGSVRAVSAAPAWLLAMLCLMLAGAAGALAAAEPAPIDHYLKRSTFTSMKISPDGRYLAATVPLSDDATGLVVIDHESMRTTAAKTLGAQQHVNSFYWVSNERLLLTVAKMEGALDRPIPTGELFAINADGSGSELLFGYRVAQSGTRVGRQPERASAYPLYMLPDSESHVLIVVEPWGGADGSFREVRRLHTVSGRMTRVARSALRQGWFLVDREGHVRITWGDTVDGKRQVHQRPASGGEWQLLHDENTAGYRILPLAFSADGSLVILREHAEGSRGVYRMSLADGAMTLVQRHDVVDPAQYLYGPHPGELYGAMFHPGLPELGFFEPDDNRQVRMAKAVAAAFPGQSAHITSFTRDGKRALVATSSDRNPGEFFLFDLEAMQASYLASVREWLKPDQLGEMRPVQLEARDGTPLHGYLQLPPGVSEPRNLPLVVNPHGGPHGVRDYWGYDPETQLLASRGYAVLKINFRGSGGYGDPFERAGHRQWGGTMQDDIADAVRWTIAQGLVDKDRVCIYGASYGGYSALMNAGRYPELYRCTAGYVGVYDLDLMYRDGDIRESLYGRKYLEEVLGRGDDMAGFSPVAYADKITMPVFLIHGGQDLRVPISHANRMRSALRAAGNDPQWLVKRNEGHGFYRMDHQRELYTKLLAFFDQTIGPQAAASRAAAAPTPGSPADAGVVADDLGADDEAAGDMTPAQAGAAVAGEGGD
ncbi:MAG: S9 family peptidase [Xanthomonadales bacterium]|nr:S9 family peptidase [Xanthomonadales bacterium]